MIHLSFPKCAVLFIILAVSLLAFAQLVNSSTQPTNAHSPRVGLRVRPAHSGDASFHVQSYIIKLRIDPAAKLISGSVTMKAVARARRLRSIALDLANNMTVTSVRSAGQDLRFTHQQNRIQVAL